MAASARATDRAPTPVRTSMPSRPNTPAISSPASGSSGGSSPSDRSTIVTFDPNRAKTWASSRPTAPPPSTTSDAGTFCVSTAS